MKKIIIMVFIGLFAVSVGYAQYGTTKFDSGVEITGALQVDGASTLTGEVTATGGVKGNVSNASSVSFSVTTDTNTTPSSAGQIVLDSNYNLFISTVSGGSWYKITRSTNAGTLGQ